MTKQQAKEKINALISEYERLKKDTKLDQNEQFTKDRFIRPLFEALGWDFRRDVWPEEQVSKGRVDYAFRIGDFNKFFVEAKKFSVDLELPKWAEQVVEYAWNRSVTWAVLTDFEGIKIFNSEWKEKPYRAIKDIRYDEYLKRFDDLWLLSRESIEKGELGTKAEEWGVKAKKEPVTKQLARDMNEWRELFTQEINEWNKDKYSKEEIDEAVQRFLDRLIFIRYAEDKELEPKMLEPLLRDFKNNPGDGNIIPKLNEVFHKFDKWYDSRLFEKHFSEEMQGYSGKVEKIIEGLYYSKETGHPYDFSAIGADVLGAVYEQYLGYLQKKGYNNGGKSKRKEQGIYYTPTFIVDYIVRNTVGELIKDKSREEVKKIKILDPACGSGSFLIKAYEVLEKYYQKYDKPVYDKDSKLGKIEQAFKDKRLVNTVNAVQKANILRDNLYGVDLDPKAVEIAQLNLLLKAITQRTKLPNLSNRIKCGNSLIFGTKKELKKFFGNKSKNVNPFNWNEEFSDEMKRGGFDVVIGNPPYIDSEEMTRTQSEVRDFLNASYSSAKGNWDLFCIFIERGLQLLSEGGYFGMILPNKLLSANYATSIRVQLAGFRILAIRDYSEIKVFGADVYPIVLIVQKLKDSNNDVLLEKVSYSDTGKELQVEEYRVKQNKFTSNNISWITGERVSGGLINKIENKTVLLKKYCVIHGALTVSESYELKKIIKEYQNQKDYLKLINTGTIDRYISLWGVKKLSYIKQKYNKPILLKPDLEKLFKNRYLDSLKKKIIVAGMTKELECVYDVGEYFPGKSTTVILSDSINLKYLTVILNSKMMTCYYKNKFRSLSLSGGFMNIGPKQVEVLPIKENITKNEINSFVKLYDSMQCLYKKLYSVVKNSDTYQECYIQINKAEKQIDQMVYKLYGLTEEEIKIVENSQ